MTTSAFFDLTRAQEFALEDDQVHELVVTFEESLTQEISVIQAALVSGEAQKVELSLHALKGFMPLFVTPSLAQTITDLYQPSRQQPLTVTGHAFTALVPTLNALQAEVQAWLRPL